jgi:hypothetical protein
LFGQVIHDTDHFIVGNASFHRLRRELDGLDRQSDPLLAKQHKSKIKGIMRDQEQQYRRRTKP